MKLIQLHGELAKKYGAIHKLAVKNVAEAIRALSANFPDFPKHLIESEDRHVAYHVVVDNTTISEEELTYPASAEIHLIPVVMGAGSASTKYIVGAALVVVGVAVGVLAGWTGVGGIAASFMIKSGAALILAGVVQSLSPQPKAPEPPERPDNKPSYNFNGPVNTTSQGQPVPIAYGRVLVGSAIISASITVDSLYPITDLPAGQVVYQA